MESKPTTRATMPVPDDPNNICLIVTNQAGQKTLYMSKRDSQFRALFKKYCDTKGVDSEAAEFLYDGNRLYKEQTPAQLEMENGSEIDVMLRMHGGGPINGMEVSI